MGVLDHVIVLADRVDRWLKRSTQPADDYLELGSSTAVIKRLSTPSSSGPHPLVLTLHGFGSDERQMATLVPLSRTGKRVHRVAVRGDWAVADGGFAWFPIAGTSPTNVTAEAGDIDEAADRLAQIIVALTAEPSVDGNQVWIIGYSQGAPMALHLLCQYSHLLQGVAVGAGSLISPVDPDTDLGEKCCFIAASTNDPFVPEADYHETQDFLRRAGAAVTVATETVPHVISTSQADAIDDWLGGFIA